MLESYADHQLRARRQSRLLILLFVGGVVATVLSFWLIVAGAIAVHRKAEWTDSLQLWQPLGAVTGGVALVVLIGSLRTLYRLRHGGPAIAGMLGGVEVPRDTRQADERKLLNVVEEMAISSGLPMPRVYLLEGDVINAFAAGYRPEDAVVGFTRGAIEKLSRDELQGVAAHEFSHIYHGDTRINARTVAAIGGIMALGTLGWVLFRFIGPEIARAEARSSRGKKKGGGGVGIAIILAGLVLWLVGSIGVLYGRLIQSAISRRREYLADASAVDYTRNPDGIAGALWKIREQGNAEVRSEAASELNHFFFASSFRSMFATHPTLESRIRRVIAMGAKGVTGDAEGAGGSQAGAGMHLGFAGVATSGRRGWRPAAVPAAGATGWLAEMPEALREAIRTPAGARAACYAVAWNPDRSEEFGRLIATRDPEAFAALPSIAAKVSRLRDDRQVAIVDLAAPALVAAGPDAYRDFRQSMRLAIREDGEIHLREWAMFVALRRHVEEKLVPPPPPSRVKRTVEQAAEPLRTVLAFGAATARSPVTAAARFHAAYAALGLRTPSMGDAGDRTVAALDEALRQLASLDVVARESIVRAFAIAIARDGEVAASEHMVLRGVAESLGVPVPAVAAG
jgi:Zn-dependent protease with chaperone function